MRSGARGARREARRSHNPKSEHIHYFSLCATTLWKPTKNTKQEKKGYSQEVQMTGYSEQQVVSTETKLLILD